MTVWRKGGGGTFLLIFTGIPYVISSHCEILRFGSSVRKKWKAMTCNLKLGSTFHWDLLPHRGSALSLLIWLNLASSHISHPKLYPWFLDTREYNFSLLSLFNIVTCQSLASFMTQDFMKWNTNKFHSWFLKTFQRVQFLTKKPQQALQPSLRETTLNQHNQHDPLSLNKS